jgi:hypothetical protein
MDGAVRKIQSMHCSTLLRETNRCRPLSSVCTIKGGHRQALQQLKLLPV